jgi:hypothetical protein
VHYIDAVEEGNPSRSIKAKSPTESSLQDPAQTRFTTKIYKLSTFSVEHWVLITQLHWTDLAFYHCACETLHVIQYVSLSWQRLILAFYLSVTQLALKLIRDAHKYYSERQPNKKGKSNNTLKVLNCAAKVCVPSNRKRCVGVILRSFPEPRGNLSKSGKYPKNISFRAATVEFLVKTSVDCIQHLVCTAYDPRILLYATEF